MISLTNSQIGELMGQFLLAGTGTLSFAILFACPRRSLPTCALVGAMGSSPACSPSCKRPP